jgi:hypothetical protein
VANQLIGRVRFVMQGMPVDKRCGGLIHADHLNIDTFTAKSNNHPVKRSYGANVP